LVATTGTTTNDLVISSEFNGSATERMRIDASGNVGIGTSSPNRRLEVTDSGSGEITLSRQMGIDGADLHWLETSVSPTNNLVTFKSTGSSNGGFTFNNASSEFMRITSTGNVGIGTSSPAAPLSVYNASNPYANFADAANYFNVGVITSNYGLINSSLPISFQISDTERARIDASGNLLVGKTSASATLDVKTTANQQVARISLDAASSTSTPAVVIAKKDNDSTTSQVFVQFLINSEGAGSGQINANGGNSAAFGSYSDERLKENIVDLPAQLENICSLRPVEFDYKAGGHQIGFIAQEMQAVYPDVVGSGSDDMLTITGWSKTEARLVKALQEAVQKIEALEARITALEGTSA
jgi:hypothetical protein